MGGVISSFGGPVGTTFFTDDVAEPRGSKLVAVVIWRSAPRTIDDRGAERPRWTPPAGWSGASDGDGRREVLLHRERRVVRVREREYPLPSDGTALLLLIDDSHGDEAPPSVTVGALAAPVYARPEVDPTLDKAARVKLILDARRAEHQTWDRAVSSDPAVRGFLAADSG